MIPLLLIAGGITLIVLGTAVFPLTFSGKPAGLNPAYFVPGIALIMFSIIPIFFIFMPKILSGTLKMSKHIIDTNKEDLTDLANIRAEINKNATYIQTLSAAKGIKNGLKNTKFCDEFGAEIDVDANFCNKCGKKQ